MNEKQLRTYRHFTRDEPLVYCPDGDERIFLAMGCFWGAERLMNSLKGVDMTSVGYTGGYERSPTYKSVCSGETGHAETVCVTFNPKIITLEEIFKVFWENHDPTQRNRQHNDIGTQYRSAIFCETKEQVLKAKESRENYQETLRKNGVDKKIVTDVNILTEYYFAEDYHQQYLIKNKHGYCGLKGLGVSCPL